MPVRIITADERLSQAGNKTSLAIFGPSGVGKTSLLKTLPADRTVCLDLEAGMKSVQDWPGASIPIRTFTDFRDLAVLIGGPDPAADPNAWYSAQHHQHARAVYAGSGVEEFLASKSIVFVDSIKVHSILTESPRQRAAKTRAQTPALLKGLIFGPTGRAMTPAHTRKGGKLYRYYVSTNVLKGESNSCAVRRVPAAEIESAVIEQVRGILRSPEIVVRTWRVARQSLEAVSEADVREALERLDPLWDELFPAEQARIVQLLVERVDVSPDGADIRLRTEGLTNLVADLRAVRPESRRAA